MYWEQKQTTKATKKLPLGHNNALQPTVWGRAPGKLSGVKGPGEWGEGVVFANSNLNVRQ